MEIQDIEAPASCRYVVAPRRGLWRVLKDGGESRTFADRDEAVGFACGAARARARSGLSGIVLVVGEVDEMHCYTPPAELRAPDPCRPRLRLVGDDG